MSRDEGGGRGVAVYLVFASCVRAPGGGGGWRGCGGGARGGCVEGAEEPRCRAGRAVGGGSGGRPRPWLSGRPRLATGARRRARRRHGAQRNPRACAGARAGGCGWRGWPPPCTARSWRAGGRGVIRLPARPAMRPPSASRGRARPQAEVASSIARTAVQPVPSAALSTGSAPPLFEGLRSLRPQRRSRRLARRHLVGTGCHEG